MPASRPSAPSYDELAALVEKLTGLLLEQNRQVDALKARIAELEARLNQSSRNSSQPPSADSPFVKPAPKSLRQKGVRRPGRPPGQPGKTLEQVEHPTYTKEYEPEQCACCDAALAGRPEVSRERRQVFDLPETALEVTEHHLVARRCRCGHVTRALAPIGVNAPVQYGPRVSGLAVGLWHGQFLAKARVAQIMRELFGASMTPGVIAGMTTRLAAQLAEFREAVRTRLAESAVVGFGETGFRVEGSLQWVHSAHTGKYSLLVVHPRRGTLGMDAMGVLPGFAGVAVHDAWGPYDTYKGATHALCGAHVLRELVAVCGTGTGSAGGLGSAALAQQVIDGLLGLKKLAEAAHAKGEVPDPKRVVRLRAVLFSAAVLGEKATLGRENNLIAKHHALFARLEKRFEDYLRFVDDPAVPFDNNGSEREIRMCKLRIKVSGSMRSMRGAEEFCLIRSYLQTTAKHGVGWLTALSDAMSGIPWMPGPTTA